MTHPAAALTHRASPSSLSSGEAGAAVSEWRMSHRFDAAALPLADRHYNRQKVGSPQFVPPGRCLVFLADAALWVTSWPFAQYVRHAWAGAWVNSLFRREGGPTASELIRAAVAHTRAHWNAPELGIVSFVSPRHVPPTMKRGQPMLPHEMPDALPITGQQQELTHA